MSNWLDISQELVDGLVHLVYGLSKDWGGSGLRVGVLYTRSPLVKEVRRGCEGVAWVGRGRTNGNAVVKVGEGTGDACTPAKPSVNLEQRAVAQ